jgi:hypothetical protein
MKFFPFFGKESCYDNFYKTFIYLDSNGKYDVETINQKLISALCLLDNSKFSTEAFGLLKDKVVQNPCLFGSTMQPNSDLLS